jgi:hypothetical protein
VTWLNISSNTLRSAAVMLVLNLLRIGFDFEVLAFAFRKLEDSTSEGDFPSSVTWACREAPADIGLPGVRRGSRRTVRVSKRNGRVMASLACGTASLGIEVATRGALAGCIRSDRLTPYQKRC